MRTCVAIRTYRWGEEEQRLFETLHPALGDALVAVVQNPAEGFEAPLPVVPLTADWLGEQRLARVGDWGWRCGDYAYYALRQARPDADFYWLVEPDIHFSSSPESFFAAFERDVSDVLALELAPFDRRHRFGRAMPDGMALYNAIFALTRMSGRALDRFFEKRRALNVEGLNRHTYANDEVFCFSNAMADPELRVGCLLDRAGSWFDGSRFATDPDMIVEELADAPAGKVFHPVRARTACKRGISGRANSRLGFLKSMSGTIAHFGDDEIEEIVADAGAILRRHLRKARREGRVAARQRR